MARLRQAGPSFSKSKSGVVLVTNLGSGEFYLTSHLGPRHVWHNCKFIPISHSNHLQHGIIFGPRPKSESLNLVVFAFCIFPITYSMNHGTAAWRTFRLQVSLTKKDYKTMNSPSCPLYFKNTFVRSLGTSYCPNHYAKSLTCYLSGCLFYCQNNSSTYDWLAYWMAFLPKSLNKRWRFNFSKVLLTNVFKNLRLFIFLCFGQSWTHQCNSCPRVPKS